MCKRCVIFTYDEVLDIVMKLEVGAPLNFNPDWPVRTTEAYPKSIAPLISARVRHRCVCTSFRTRIAGSTGAFVGIRGILETRRRIQHTNRKRHEADLARIHATSTLHSSRPRFLRDASRRNPIPHPKRENPSNANTNSVFLSRILSSSAARGVEAPFPW